MPRFSVDDKMPFMEHLGELRTRIMRSLFWLLGGTFIGLLVTPIKVQLGPLMNGIVIVQNNNHKVHAVDAASGQKKWEFETDK